MFSEIIEEYNIKTLEDAFDCEELWDINNGRTLCEECHNEETKKNKRIMKNKTKRSKYWDTLVDILDGQFPKGECKERGRAMVMLAYIEMMLTGTKFNEDGEPKINN